VAIKTLIFEDSHDSRETALIASEAAIASNLSHRNIVATYSHDVCSIAGQAQPEPSIFKFYLIQVRLLALLPLPAYVLYSGGPARIPEVGVQRKAGSAMRR
jgi:hypothetical protein